MKTISKIKRQIAKEAGERHFEVLLEAELSVGDFETARKLLIDATNRYIDQLIKENTK